MTFYRSSEQLPDYEDYSMKGRTYRYFDDPLYAFGYGLSYTAFSITNAKIRINDGEYAADAVKSSSPEAGDPLSLSLSQLNAQLLVPVTNTGRRDGTEVVQLYVRDLNDSEGPLKSLRGFQRVAVKAGQTVTAVLPITAKTFELFDPSTNTVHAHSGRYELLYGTSSRSEDLQRLEVELK